VPRRKALGFEGIWDQGGNISKPPRVRRKRPKGGKKSRNRQRLKKKAGKKVGRKSVTKGGGGVPEEKRISKRKRASAAKWGKKQPKKTWPRGGPSGKGTGGGKKFPVTKKKPPSNVSLAPQAVPLKKKRAVREKSL